MKTKKRKFKCTGCGTERPCYIETNQEDTDFFCFDEDDLVCILDATNQTSFNWLESKDMTNEAINRDRDTSDWEFDYER